MVVYIVFKGSLLKPVRYTFLFFVLWTPLSAWRYDVTTNVFYWASDVERRGPSGDDRSSEWNFVMFCGADFRQAYRTIQPITGN